MHKYIFSGLLFFSASAFAYYPGGVVKVTNEMHADHVQVQYVSCTNRQCAGGPDLIMRAQETAEIKVPDAEDGAIFELQIVRVTAKDANDQVLRITPDSFRDTCTTYPVDKKRLVLSDKIDGKMFCKRVID